MLLTSHLTVLQCLLSWVQASDRTVSLSVVSYTPDQKDVGYIQDRIHRRRHGNNLGRKSRGTYKRKPYDHDRTPHYWTHTPGYSPGNIPPYEQRTSDGDSTTLHPLHPYVDYNMSNFPFHMYQTNPYVKDAQFNMTFGSKAHYTTTENIFLLYDDILRKKLINHRARLFNDYDRYFPILFKRAWKYAVGTLFFDNCDSENYLFYPKAKLTRSDAIYVFYEFLKKMRRSLKAVLTRHFQQIPDHSEDIVFTQEKSINDMRYAFYTIENFISYDSADVEERIQRMNSTVREYSGHIDRVNEHLMNVIFPFVEKRYFNFLKNFKYPAARDETILTRDQIGEYLNKLCYKVAREIHKEPFFRFPYTLRVTNYTSEEREIIAKYNREKGTDDVCETCEEREMIRNKKMNRV